MKNSVKDGVLDPADYPYLEEIKDITLFSKEEFKDCQNNPDSQILIMAGHFMAFSHGNRLYPSYVDLSELPEEVREKRISEKMKTFSAYTFRYGCELTASLKAAGYKNVKMFILANDITHVWDAYSHVDNVKKNDDLQSLIKEVFYISDLFKNTQDTDVSLYILCVRAVLNKYVRRSTKVNNDSMGLIKDIREVFSEDKSSDFTSFVARIRNIAVDASKIYSMHELRQMLLVDFYFGKKLPTVYLQALKDNGLTVEDLLSYEMPYLHTTKSGNNKWKTKTIYCVRELTLQNNFDRFAKESLILKEPFGYGRGNNDEALKDFMGDDPVLNTMLEQMMYCAQKDLPEMPGGIACSKETMSLYAVNLGVRDGVSKKVPALYTPAKKFLYNVCINLIPMGCRDAVVAASLISYRKIHPLDTHLRIINIPCASNTEKTNIQLLNGLRDH